LNLLENRNIQHFLETFVKMENMQNKNGKSTHFDHKVNIIVPTSTVGQHFLLTEYRNAKNGDFFALP